MYHIVWVCYNLVSCEMCKCIENQSNYSTKATPAGLILPVSCMCKFPFFQLKVKHSLKAALFHKGVIINIL